MTDEEILASQVAQAKWIERIDAEMERLRALFPDMSALTLRRIAADSLDAEAERPQ